MELLEYIESKYYKVKTLQKLHRTSLKGLEDKIERNTNYTLIDFQNLYKQIKRYDMLIPIWDIRKIIDYELEKQNKTKLALCTYLDIPVVAFDKIEFRLKELNKISKYLKVPPQTFKEIYQLEKCFKVNKNRQYVNMILEKIKNNDSYCCCQIHKTDESKCPLVYFEKLPQYIEIEKLCTNGAKNKICFCGVYEEVK